MVYWEKSAVSTLANKNGSRRVVGDASGAKSHSSDRLLGHCEPRTKAALELSCGCGLDFHGLIAKPVNENPALATLRGGRRQSHAGHRHGWRGAA